MAEKKKQQQQKTTNNNNNNPSEFRSEWNTYQFKLHYLDKIFHDLWRGSKNSSKCSQCTNFVWGTYHLTKYWLINYRKSNECILKDNQRIKESKTDLKLPPSLSVSLSLCCLSKTLYTSMYENFQHIFSTVVANSAI